MKQKKNLRIISEVDKGIQIFPEGKDCKRFLEYVKKELP
jgi:hypothetical protein